MKRFHRLILCLVLMNAASGLQAALEPARVTLDYIVDKAYERASRPFHSPRADLPSVLRADELDYDKYRRIQFRHDQALWAEEGLPFRVEFFHPGYLYAEPVRINEFTANYTQPVRFARGFFDYADLDIADKIPARTGYAGFKILYELNGPGRWDELGAFLGASYYRLLGQNQRYGQSARGLALDCGEYGRPEEFPIFTDWWLGKPEENDTTVQLRWCLRIPNRPRQHHRGGHPGGPAFPNPEEHREGCPGAAAAQDHRARPADQHVLVRQKFRTKVRRLPAGGARQRRSAGQV